MPSPYELLYAKSPFQLDVLNPPTQKKRWYEMSPVEKQQELMAQQQKLGELPVLPERKTFKERMKPLLNVLQIVGGVLNVPSAMISGAMKQLVDGAPGFDTQEYFKDVFGFKDQVSWTDVIQILSDDDKDNVWDKKWAQIAAGLTLDILLDPLTYFGAGVVKGTKMGTAAREIAEQSSKLLRKKGTLVANRAYKNVLNRSFEKVWGIQLPWQFGKISVPFRTKTGKAMADIVGRYHEVTKGLGAAKKTLPIEDFLRFKQVGKQQLERAAKEILPLARKRTPAQAISDVLRKVPGYDWLERAFMPSRQAKIGIIEAKLKMMHGTGQDLAPMEREIMKMVRGKNGKQLRKVLEVMETVPYVDHEVVKYVTKMADDFTNFAIAYEKSDIPWQKLLEKYAKDNEEFAQVLSKGVRKLLSDYEGRKALNKMGMGIKVTAKPTPEQLIKEMGAIYDKTSAKQAMVAFEKAGIKPGHLTNLAKFEPKWDVEKIFTKLGKELTVDQKNSMLRLMNTTRDTLDYWWDVERAANLPEGYVRDYLSRATGEVRKIGKPMELGGVPGFTLERFSDMPMTKRFDIAVEQLIKDGIARSKKHARRLLREGKIQEYGRMVDTVHEMLYMRGVAHTKAIHKMQYLDEVKKLGIRVPKDAPIGKGLAKIVDVPELADYAFTLDDAQFINRALSTLANDKSINQFLGAIDRTQGWWKSLVTVVNPGFH